MREPKNPDRLFEKALLANRVDGEQEPDFGLFYFATTKKAAKTTALILIFDQNFDQYPNGTRDTHAMRATPEPAARVTSHALSVKI